MTATAATYHFRLQRGIDFSRSFKKKVQATDVPVDLTGLKARAQFRTVAGAEGTSTVETLLLDLLDGAGVSVSDPINGTVTLSLSNAQTTLLCPTNKRTQVSYGIELYDDSGPTELSYPFLQGKVTLLPESVR
jgi:hypothetical protein